MKRSRTQSEPPELEASQQDKIDALSARILELEERVEGLSWRAFYESSTRNLMTEPGILMQARYVASTTSGWLVVLINNTRTSLPSGLKVDFIRTVQGRDYGTVLEGYLAGSSFDVTTGNLQVSYRRLSDLALRVKPRPGGPIDVDGEMYDLQLSISYKENGQAKTAGPFAAKTDPQNPLPEGDHDLEIADYPHQSPYGDPSTVWFRIGHSGDRYLHAGRVSAGCITCAPRNWRAIYDIVNCARVDTRTAGKLNFSQSLAASKSKAKAERKTKR
ncbi:hypothetical protein [Sphingosinicella sp. CPCC 101087]|uniref:hypothetical protein n=1 Tax=Sphingosinicella sp. CPCC 101087 TaxID=2497754 RepID=UPI00101C0573|nr:hypothetical protein [Sphingosinicella sp. CPCC 101087]